MPGMEKYIYGVLVVLMLFPILSFLAAMLFPPIIRCEFTDGSFKRRLAINSADAARLLEIVKTSENLKTMSAMVKTSLENAVELSNLLLAFLASVGIFIVSFTVLLGLKLIDGGVLISFNWIGGRLSLDHTTATISWREYKEEGMALNY